MNENNGEEHKYFCSPYLAAIRSSARRSRSWASDPRASEPPPNSPHQKGLLWDTGRDAVESLRILKSVPLDFDQCTPVKDRPPSAVKFSGNFSMSPTIKGRAMRDGSAVRSSAGGALLSKMMETPMMRKSCVITPSAYNTLEAEGEAGEVAGAVGVPIWARNDGEAVSGAEAAAAQQEKLPDFDSFKLPPTHKRA